MAFLPEPDLQPGERIVDAWPANRVQSGWRAVGGKLWLTDRRLVFTPHALESKLAGRGWAVQLTHVTGVGIAPRELTKPLAGGARERLRITTSEGEQLFVVALEPALDQIRASLGGAQR